MLKSNHNKHRMADASAPTEKKEPRRRGPRRGAGGRKPRPTSAGGEGAKRELRPSAEVAESAYGKVQFGRVCDVLNRGREKFGFVYILPSDGFVPKNEDGTEGLGFSLYGEYPRVYFSFSEWKEELKARKNDVVTFTVLKDDKDRPYASSVSFTPSGKTAAVAREEAFKLKAAEAPAKAPKSSEQVDAEKKERKEKKTRKPIDTRSVVLKVTAEGFSETKEVTAVIGETLGKLKHSGVVAFECPIHFTIYHKGELLTKAVLEGLSDGDSIHLGEPKPKADA